MPASEVDRRDGLGSSSSRRRRHGSVSRPGSTLSVSTPRCILGVPHPNPIFVVFDSGLPETCHGEGRVIGGRKPDIPPSSCRPRPSPTIQPYGASTYGLVKIFFFFCFLLFFVQKKTKEIFKKKSSPIPTLFVGCDRRWSGTAAAGRDVGFSTFDHPVLIVAGLREPGVKNDKNRIRVWNTQNAPRRRHGQWSTRRVLDHLGTSRAEPATRRDASSPLSQ